MKYCHTKRNEAEDWDLYYERALEEKLEKVLLSCASQGFPRVDEHLWYRHVTSSDDNAKQPFVKLPRCSLVVGNLDERLLLLLLQPKW